MKSLMSTHASTAVSGHQYRDEASFDVLALFTYYNGVGVTPSTRESVTKVIYHFIVIVEWVEGAGNIFLQRLFTNPKPYRVYYRVEL